MLSISSIQLNAQTVKLLDKVHLSKITEVYIFSGSSYVITNEFGMADVSDFSRNDTIVIQHRDYNNFKCTFKQLQDMEYLIMLTPNVIHVDEIVVSANRIAQNVKEVPNKIVSISRRDIEFHNPQTSADLLKISDEVFVQKSQLGGGSPMIRGYSANRVLIVTDGVRMNNAIFRSGNLQNIIALDPNIVENTEVIFGPGSVVYGSDAIGGVMSFSTLPAKISGTDNTNHSLKMMGRYSSANNEKTGHLNFNLGNKTTAFRTAVSYSDFDDLRMGSRKHDEYRRMHYVDRPYRKDLMIENDDPEVQRFSGYSQVNLMQKIRFVPNDNWDFNYGILFSKSSDVPRYDRLLEYSGDSLKYAEWYYGPQVWQMQNFTLTHSQANKIYDELLFTAAYQNFKESRHDRKFGKETIRERFENVHAVTGNLDFHKTIFHDLKLFYGLEFVENIIYSEGRERSLINNNTNEYAPRYPDNSRYYSSAAYFSFAAPFFNTFNFSGGIRYNEIFIKAPFDNTFYDFPFDEINSQTGALTGSLGLNHRPVDNTLVNMNFSSGFRAPNIDDMGKVFDSEPGNVIVPNPDLKPEYAYNADFGITQMFGNNIEARFSAFYSYLHNALVRRDFSFNGRDSILYDGEMSRVQALVNADNATVYGFNLSLKSNMGNSLSFKGNINYSEGRDNEDKPLRHVSPFFSNASLVYTRKQFKMDFSLEYNGEISYEDLAESEREKAYMYAADKNGNPYSPSWYTLNLTLTLQVNKALSLNTGMENILDHRYRPYSSGIVAPGRNIIVSLIFNL